MWKRIVKDCGGGKVLPYLCFLSLGWTLVKIGSLEDWSMMSKVWKWKLKWLLITWLFLHWFVVCWNRKAMPEFSLTFLGSEFTCLLSAFRAPSKLACHLPYRFIVSNWYSWGKNRGSQSLLERQGTSKVIYLHFFKWEMWGPERWSTSPNVHRFLGQRLED